MNTLLVGYDLNKSGQDYKDLVEFLKSQDGWWHHLDSTWIIKTNQTAADFLDSLIENGHIDSNDEVLVVNITGDLAAWIGFSEKGSNWLKEHI